MQRECDVCGRLYTARRASARFCSGTCGKRSQRARAAGIPSRASTSDDREAPPSELARATIREPEAAGRLRTAAGQVAVELARRVASPHETGVPDECARVIGSQRFAPPCQRRDNPAVRPLTAPIGVRTHRPDVGTRRDHRARASSGLTISTNPTLP